MTDCKLEELKRLVVIFGAAETAEEGEEEEEEEGNLDIVMLVESSKLLSVPSAPPSVTGRVTGEGAICVAPVFRLLLTKGPAEGG